MQHTFSLLQRATRLHTPSTIYYNLVDDWQSKREIVAVLLADLPIIAKEYESVERRPYQLEPRITISDPVPRVRLMAAAEATVNALYGLADVGASFASKATKDLPASFNKIAKKVRELTSDDPLKCALGDLGWYARIREIRTEWSHHSTVFVSEDENKQTTLTLRDYRRSTDKCHFTQTSHFTIKELIAWTEAAILTLDVSVR